MVMRGARRRPLLLLGLLAARRGGALEDVVGKQKRECGCGVGVGVFLGREGGERVQKMRVVEAARELGLRLGEDKVNLSACEDAVDQAGALACELGKVDVVCGRQTVQRWRRAVVRGPPAAPRRAPMLSTSSLLPDVRPNWQ